LSPFPVITSLHQWKIKRENRGQVAVDSTIQSKKLKNDLGKHVVFFSILALFLVFSFSSNGLTSLPTLLSASAQTSPPPIWPTIQHDFQRTSAGSTPGPASNSTDWLFGPTGSIQSSPIIGSDGTIYIVDANFHFFAIRPDGSIKWEKTFTEGLFSPAIGPAGTIYIPGTRHLFAFTPNGNPAWTVPYNLTTSRNSALAISPQGIIFEINSTGTLFAINPFGTVASTVWKLDVSCIPATLALSPSGSLYCGTGTNGTGAELKSVSSNGQLQWTYSTNSIVLVPPAIGPDGSIYVVSSGGEIFALSSTGTTLWTISDIHQEVTSAIIGPGYNLYVAGTLGGSNKVISITQTGTVLWSEFCYVASNSLCFPFGTVTSMAVDASGALYVGTNSSGLVSLNSDGTLNWAYTTIPSNEGSLSPIAIGNDGTLYVGTGCLFCNSTTYGHLLAIGQPSGFTKFTVGESGLPPGNSWSFILNGENYTTSSSSLSFSLPNGSYSWQSPPSPLPGNIGVRFAASNLQGSFSAPVSSAVSLSFSIQYQVNFTASPGVGGTVSPIREL
jgi:PQQ-like domain